MCKSMFEKNEVRFLKRLDFERNKNLSRNNNFEFVVIQI